MSVSFIYSPVKKQQRLHGGTSNNISVLNEMFGEEPWRLTEASLPTLRAMAVAVRSDALKWDSFYDEIINAVERYGEIIVGTGW